MNIVVYGSTSTIRYIIKELKRIGSIENLLSRLNSIGLVQNDRTI